MDADRDADVTTLLKNAAGGDRAAENDLYRLVHQTLRHIAEQRMQQERMGHTLQATALVHEAWIKLVGDAPINWTGRSQFYATAANAMRQVLIDHARQRGAVKRGGEMKRSLRNISDLAAQDSAEEILALDDAISQLEKEEPDVAAVVRLRFFAGLTIDETAKAIGQSPRNVDRLWTYARARLFRMLIPKN